MGASRRFQRAGSSGNLYTFGGMSCLYALVRCCTPNRAIPRAGERDPILQGSHLISGVNQRLISKALR